MFCDPAYLYYAKIYYGPSPIYKIGVSEWPGRRLSEVCAKSYLDYQLLSAEQYKDKNDAYAAESIIKIVCKGELIDECLAEELCLPKTESFCSDVLSRDYEIDPSLWSNNYSMAGEFNYNDVHFGYEDDTLELMIKLGHTFREAMRKSKLMYFERMISDRSCLMDKHNPRNKSCLKIQTMKSALMNWK